MTDLNTVQEGTSFLLSAMGELTDDELRAPSRLAGWTRSHVLAHVAYNAQALSRLVDWAATGIERPMYASPEARLREIESGAALDPDALRHFVEQSAEQLDARWLGLPSESWSAEVVTAQGRTVPVSETIWMRTREVWIHAIDLDCGRGFAEVPAEVLHRLLRDVTGAWERRGELGGIRLTSTSHPGLDLGDLAADERAAVRATTPELAAWALGRADDPAPTWAHGRRAPAWI